MRTPRGYPTLDLLRLVAITLTLLVHVTSIAHNVPVVRVFRDGMWLGVDLFMLISGWLLGGQLLRDADVDAKRFWFKRWMRTLPPYYVMLIVLFATRTGGFENGSWWNLACHALFIQFYVFAPGARNLYFISWSLCVEEHFYLLLPFVIVVIRKLRSAGALFAIVIGIETLSITLRVIALQSEHTGVPMVTHLRCHGLFLGLFFAYLAQERPVLWARLGAFAAYLGLAGIVGTLGIMATVGPPGSLYAFVVAPTLGTWMLALVFIPCVHASSAWSRLSFRGLAYAGELTFGIYLIHAVIPKSWIGSKVTESPIRGFVLRFGIMIACAIALHELVERPALKLRAKVLARWRRRDAALSTP